MNRKTYIIKGFDCPHCALKVEEYLNKQDNIEKASIDFNNDKLDISFKDQELSIEELLSLIKEVEEDDISIYEKEIEEESFFNKENIINISRICIAIIIMVLGLTVFKEAHYFWVNFAIHLVGLLLVGYDVFYKVIYHIIHLQNPLDEHLLMSLASIGAFLIASITKSNDFFDSLMVLSLWQIGELIEDIVTDKSKKAIKNTFSLRVELVHKIDGDSIIDISPKSVNVDDVLLVNKGELVPLDGVIISGEGLLDTSSLTGEFVPINSKQDLKIYSGYIVKEGSIKMRVDTLYSDSALNKINNLITDSASKKSKADNFVTKFARRYTPIIFIVSIFTFLIGGLITHSWSYYLLLGLKMLVVGCPCAIVISVPLSYFASLGLASKRGIIIKGSNYLDKINDLDILVTDKTGTLTKGEFVIKDICPVSSKEELLEALYLSECLSNHPIGKGICRDIDISKYRTGISDFKEYTGKGVSVIYQNEEIISGSYSLLKEMDIDVIEASNSGLVIYVSRNKRYLGYISLIDEEKKESKELLNYLDRHDIDTLLLSGDKKDNVKRFATRLGIKNYLGELFPDQKIEELEKCFSNHKCVGYLGDGVNDAASIKRSDIGFAMGVLGSDEAVENADVVIMNDNPYKVVESMKVAKVARHTSLFNIFFALFIKIGIEVAALTTTLLGHPEIIPMWVAVLTDTGLSVVLIINALLVLYRKID